jgi:DNA methylase
MYEGQVDCIYIDSPYNTGARDWKYNNRYVDNKDAWKHSKWLSFMEKRLRLAKRLLKPDGVLIVTIDEHEVHHLGMLLEKLVPDAYRQMVSIVINPKGVTQGRFSLFLGNLNRFCEQFPEVQLHCLLCLDTQILALVLPFLVLRDDVVHDSVLILTR